MATDAAAGARSSNTAGGFRLDGGGDSIVFLTGLGGAPRLAYWGPRLGAADRTGALAALTERAPAAGDLDCGDALNAFPEAGRAFNGHPALDAHRAGRELITELEMRSALCDGASARVLLADDLAEIEVELELEIDGDTGVLACRSRLRNLGPPLTVDWLAAGAFSSPHADVLAFDGRHLREFQLVSASVGTGLFVKENRTGHTSHHAPPFLIVGEPGLRHEAGEALGLHLAWSGDHRILAERLRDGRMQIQAGELFHPGEITLDAGEEIASPTLYLARSETGLNGLSDRFHPFVRKRILDGRLDGVARPVGYNTWEAVYFDHGLERLKGLADLAAAVGVERFVLDDGWFKGRDDDHAGLGDWTADAAKYPHGLDPLIAHVRSLGMTFGLWVEPEMANPASDLLRAHPGWILGDPLRRAPLGRNQLVLDLTRDEVAETVFAQIDALLARHEIGYLKWDMNRDLAHAVSGGRAATHRQTLAVYALIDRLRSAHPHVEIESCSSGGGRADFAILRRADRIWASDSNDPIERAAIQRGFSVFFPPEVMGAHVGPARSHTSLRTTDLNLRAYTAFLGHFGIEADLSAFSAEERARLAAIIAEHKAWRGLLHAGRTLRLDHADPGMLASIVVGAERALLIASQVATPIAGGLPPLRVPGLAPEALYAVRRLNPSAEARPGGPALHLGEPVLASGAVLARTGIALPPLRAGDILVFAFDRARAGD